MHSFVRHPAPKIAHSIQRRPEKLKEHGVPFVYALFLGLYHAFVIDEDASERAMYFVDRFLTEYLVT
jgi:hypothetical protein